MEMDESLPGLIPMDEVEEIEDILFSADRKAGSIDNEAFSGGHGSMSGYHGYTSAAPQTGGAYDVIASGDSSVFGGTNTTIRDTSGSVVMASTDVPVTMAAGGIMMSPSTDIDSLMTGIEADGIDTSLTVGVHNMRSSDPNITSDLTTENMILTESFTDRQALAVAQSQSTDPQTDSQPYPPESFSLPMPTMHFPDIFLDAQEAPSPQTDKEMVSDIFDIEAPSSTHSTNPPYFPRLEASPTDMENVGFPMNDCTAQDIQLTQHQALGDTGSLFQSPHCSMNEYGALLPDKKDLETVIRNDDDLSKLNDVVMEAASTCGDTTMSPDQVSATEPDKGSATEPDKGSATDSEPDKALATEPDQTSATDPDQTSATDPDKGSATEPDKGSATEPDKRSATDSEPDKALATEPDQTSATEPDQTSATEPDKGSATEPDKGSATEPDKVAATDPDQTSATEPDKGSATEPDKGSATEPDKASTTDPDNATIADPDKTSTIDPYNASAIDSDKALSEELADPSTLDSTQVLAKIPSIGLTLDLDLGETKATDNTMTIDTDMMEGIDTERTEGMIDENISLLGANMEDKCSEDAGVHVHRTDKSVEHESTSEPVHIDVEVMRLEEQVNLSSSLMKLSGDAPSSVSLHDPDNVEHKQDLMVVPSVKASSSVDLEASGSIPYFSTMPNESISSVNVNESLQVTSDCTKNDSSICISEGSLDDRDTMCTGDVDMLPKENQSSPKSLLLTEISESNTSESTVYDNIRPANIDSMCLPEMKLHVEPKPDDSCLVQQVDRLVSPQVIDNPQMEPSVSPREASHQVEPSFHPHQQMELTDSPIHQVEPFVSSSKASHQVEPSVHPHQQMELADSPNHQMEPSVSSRVAGQQVELSLKPHHQIETSVPPIGASHQLEQLVPPRATGHLMELSVPPSMVDTESSNLSYVSASTSTTQPLNVGDIIKAGIDTDDVFLPGEGHGGGDVSTVHRASVDQWCTQQASMSEQEAEQTDARSSIKFNPDNIPLEYEEPEFDWEEYMEDTNTVAALHTAFSHVETSLRSNFEKGMKFEVPHSDPTRYWIATVMMPCGQLLRLRYDGINGDASKDFWSDAFTSDIHPLGWCKQNNKVLEPPDEVKELLPDWQTYTENTLQQATTASDQLLGGGLGTAAVDHIKQGMMVEIQHDYDLTRVWIARILENIGGRLLLRYEGTDSASQDFWLFYLHNRIHPMGWALEMDMQYGPPEVVAEEWSRDEGWKAVLEKAQSETHNLPFPDEVLADQEMVLDHSFREGWRLEALHPIKKNEICPATVQQVFSDMYFLVSIDDLNPALDDTPVQMCCHGGSRNIFPINWSQNHNLTLMPPNGWEKEFTWPTYLAEMNAEAAPSDVFNLDCGEVSLVMGMRLEAASPEHPGQISVATVTTVCEPLVLVHLESCSKQKSFHMVDCQSHDIFPVGWCDSNNYPLKPPHRAFFTPRQRQLPTQNIQDTRKSSESSQQKLGVADKGSSWCPKIYFNHRCFSGPYLSKGRIAELPKCVGPGPVTLVMKEVLSMLINVAYKSSRVLREIQVDGPTDPTLHQQVLKAKYKGKSYRAMVELCKTSDQVIDFCRSVCIRLECCPYLFNPRFVNGQCPENCSQHSKTKYTGYVGKKKKKVGRPPGGHTNLEGGAKKPGKRRKRRRINFLKVKKCASTSAVSVKDEDYDELEAMLMEESSNSTVASLDYTELDSPRRKRKYTRHVAPPLEMKTRGVKLPCYSMERRTRQPRFPMDYMATDTQTDTQTLSRKNKSMRKSAFMPVKTEDTISLNTNPLFWSIPEVCEYIRTTDCAPLVKIFKEEEIDGQALLLLTLPTVQEIMEVKLGPAIKLCHLIENLKIAFYQQYALKM